MCKRHYKEDQNGSAEAEAGESNGDQQQHGENGDAAAAAAPQKKARIVKSVYDHVLPNSIRWNPLRSGPPAATATSAAAMTDAAAAARHAKGGTDPAPKDLDEAEGVGAVGQSTAGSSVNDNAVASAAAAAAMGRFGDVMPLVLYLRKGRKKPFGWHRRDERIATAANPLPVKAQMEPWERRLVRLRVCKRRALRNIFLPNPFTDRAGYRGNPALERRHTRRRLSRYALLLFENRHVTCTHSRQWLVHRQERALGLQFFSLYRSCSSFGRSGPRLGAGERLPPPHDRHHVRAEGGRGAQGPVRPGQGPVVVGAEQEESRRFRFAVFFLGCGN
jgi:hypothetical protein